MACRCSSVHSRAWVALAATVMRASQLGPADPGEATAVPGARVGAGGERPLAERMGHLDRPGGGILERRAELGLRPRIRGHQSLAQVPTAQEDAPGAHIIAAQRL